MSFTYLKLFIGIAIHSEWFLSYSCHRINVGLRFNMNDIIRITADKRKKIKQMVFFASKGENTGAVEFKVFDFYLRERIEFTASDGTSMELSISLKLLDGLKC